MLVVKGKIGDRIDDVLRDIGCSGIVVKKEFVLEGQFIGDFNCVLLIDNIVRKVLIVWIIVDIFYLFGEVDVEYFFDVIYDW